MSEPEALKHRRGMLLESINARRRQRQQARYDRQQYDGSQQQQETPPHLKFIKR